MARFAAAAGVDVVSGLEAIEGESRPANPGPTPSIRASLRKMPCRYRARCRSTLSRFELRILRAVRVLRPLTCFVGAGKRHLQRHRTGFRSGWPCSSTRLFSRLQLRAMGAAPPVPPRDFFPEAMKCRSGDPATTEAAGTGTVKHSGRDKRRREWNQDQVCQRDPADDVSRATEFSPRRRKRGRRRRGRACSEASGNSVAGGWIASICRHARSISGVTLERPRRQPVYRHGSEEVQAVQSTIVHQGQAFSMPT